MVASDTQARHQVRGYAKDIMVAVGSVDLKAIALDHDKFRTNVKIKWIYSTEKEGSPLNFEGVCTYARIPPLLVFP